LNILVIAAHPDDEVLGLGGTIKKLSKNGNNVKIVIMATGIKARRSKNYSNSDKYEINDKISNELNSQIQILRKESTKSSKILGAKSIDFLNFPDNEMDTVSLLEVTKSIEKIISDFNPEIVYTHTNFDVNIDHRICNQATLVATRPQANTKIKQVISYEVPSSTEWYFPHSFSPNIFVDISHEINAKKNALKCYTNEIQNFPHPRSVEALDALSKKWGSVSGFKHAEAFYLLRKLE
jgi:LmbE family N-acetylglucosaminyl deacetylase